MDDREWMYNGHPSQGDMTAELLDKTNKFIKETFATGKRKNWCPYFKCKNYKEHTKKLIMERRLAAAERAEERRLAAEDRAAERRLAAEDRAAERAEERLLADERMQQALWAQNTKNFQMFMAYCTQNGMADFDFSALTLHPTVS
ncbi:hypothetical protein D1007_08444 [Hordeum vulgare]|nr:hypothetical protein D1007_08444 [Hordeum vulgare]